MAKHRSHIQRPILEESKGKLNSKFDFIVSGDIGDWMFPKSTDGRKRRSRHEKEQVV